MPIAALRLLGVVLLGLLVGCSNTPLTQNLNQSHLEYQPRRLLLKDVPFNPQQEYQCGPAALATLLQHQGLTADPEALVAEVYLPARQGSLQMEMLAAARQRGLIPHRMEASLQDLILELQQGHPVLVFQNLGLTQQPVWHYAVLIGYDLDLQVFYLHSGTLAEHPTPFALFERTWRRGDYWAYLLLPSDQLPATGNMNNHLQAIHQMELTGQNEVAMTGYLTAAQHWPQEALPQLMAANQAWKLQQPEQTSQLLLNLLKQQPDNHAAWNNLTHVLEQDTRCPAQAQQAASCRDQLSETDNTDKTTGNADSSRCPIQHLPSCPDTEAREP
ncbi:MAG: PA2778 family cysteine peptidase [Marinospirillum sp.]|uniref:PA2778 family cysteine peptidase n=1 Tax=Marinospirillum sp. TaxID=2183934 RepID=UPI0019EB5F0C|nr:PA2778 family cysteine peptidase [Marinospirillum sp.]MBE0505494.1 PA2778 family cysteine peptidase [Marinospirillum sp.]